MQTINEFIRTHPYLNTEELLKVYGELVVDECVEKATLSYRQIDNKGFTFVATKESILNLKKLLI